MRKVLILATALFWPAISAQAEQVDLDAVLRAAVQHRPHAEAARQQAAASRAAVEVARSGYYPQVALKETFLATDEPAGSLFLSLNQERLVLHPTADPYNDPPSRRDFETRISLEQTLFDQQLVYGLRRALKSAEKTEADACWSEEQAAFAAFRAYLGVQQAMQALAWVDSSLKEAEEVVRLARQRENAGVGLKADTMGAQVRLAEAERRQLATANDLTLARRRLAYAMGREGGEVSILRPLTPEDIPALITQPPVPRADLRSALLAAEEIRLGRRQTQAEFLPRVGLFASYAWHDKTMPFGLESDSWQVGAGLTWEVFDGWRRTASVDQSSAQLRSAELEALETRRTIDLEREEAALRAAEAESQLASARQGVDAALEGYRLLKQRFEAGLSDLSDLFAAQAALDRARYDHVAAESSLLLARGILRLQQGTFVQTMLAGKEGQP